MSKPKQNGGTNDAGQKQSSRIPMALQAVFLASNRGVEVTQAPEGNLANKTFARTWFGSKARFRMPKRTWSFKKKNIWKAKNAKYEDPTADTNSVTTESTSVSYGQRKDIPGSININEAPAKQQCHKLNDSDSTAMSMEKLNIPPQDYLDEILASRGYSTAKTATLNTGYYAKPTPLQMASYHPHLIQLARDGDNDELMKIMKCGISTNPCNNHSESLIHTVCRRCEPETLQVLLDAGSRLQVSDDYGRTPLHDACWRVTPCFEMVEKIANEDLQMFYLADKRGFTPLSYVPSDSWDEWATFIESKKDIWWPSKNSDNGNGEMQRNELLHASPDSHPIPDPENAMVLEYVALVTSGRVTAKEAIRLNSDGSKMETLEESKEGDSESENSDESFSDDDYSDSDSSYGSDDDYSSCSDSSIGADDVAEIMGLLASAKVHG